MSLDYSPYFYSLDKTVTIGNFNGMGIKNIIGTANKISIYPNPASSILNVALRQAEGANVEMTLVDVLGNEVYLAPTLRQAQGSAYTIDISSIANGVYFINLKTSEGLLTKKLVVQH